MPTWFDIKAKAESEADVFLYDEIGGWGVNAKDFINEVRATGAKKINLRINSPGGSVFDGLAIFNFLKGLDVTVQVDGLAASIASIIAMAGKEVKIAGNGFLMIHNPWGGAVGDSEEMRQTADLLDKIRDSLVGTYAAKTGQNADTIKQWMDSETWFSAREAKDAGFVDTITDEIAFSASTNRFAKTPDALKAQNHPKKKMENLIKALLDAGLLKSSDVSDEAAVAQFTEAFSSIKQSLESNIEKVTEDLNAAKAKLNEYAKAEIVAAVDAAVTDGRIKAEAKDAWVCQITSDPKAMELLVAIQAPKPGSEPVGSPAANVQPPVDLRAEFDSITDPKARTAFWSANKAQLLKR